MYKALRQFLLVLIIASSLPMLAMEEVINIAAQPSTEKSERAAERTLVTLAGTIDMANKLFHPPTEIEASGSTTPSPQALQQAVAIIRERSNPASLFAQAQAFVGNTESMMPSVKTSDYRTIQESTVLAGMHFRPEYFKQKIGDEENNLDANYGIGQQLVQEFVQNGPLDQWESLIEQKIKAAAPESDSSKAALEMLSGIAAFVRRLGSSNSPDPSQDPLNKYVDPAEIKEAIALREKLDQHSDDEDEEYYENDVRLKKLNFQIGEKRTEALKEGAEYLFSLMKRLDPDLAAVKTAADLEAFHAQKYEAKKLQEFKDFILHNYANLDQLTPDFLSDFWETIERQQYGKIYYQIICESFEDKHKDSLLHRRAQHLWLASQLDTMNQNPKIARSRMPGASFDGTPGPNFGYAMGKSEAYEGWLENPFALSCGDIIVDAFHAIVDFGCSLNIDAFLDRFQQHLSDDKHEQRKYFQKSTQYDAYMIPFQLFLLDDVYHTPFISDGIKMISDELTKIAGKNLLKEARTCLEQFQKFAKKMYTLRPAAEESKKKKNESPLVFGIGFNGRWFGTPDHSRKAKNEIYVAFSDSGRTRGGNLLLMLLKTEARDVSSLCEAEVRERVSKRGSRYNTLIQHQLREKIKHGYRRDAFTDFLWQWENYDSYEDFSDEFIEWLKDYSNWYSIPNSVKIKIAPPMPKIEHAAQCIARNLLFDAILGRRFSAHSKQLMPYLFLHWKKEVVELLENEEMKSTVEKATNLDQLPEITLNKVLLIIDSCVNNVHHNLKAVWIPSILEKFQPRNGVSNMQTIAKLATLNTYSEWREDYFMNRNVAQCIEPVFTRVLGHDRFFPVFIAREAKSPIFYGQPPVRLQLGNTIPQDVIEPCDNRCQHHALGHLYTGDMLGYQSADHLDAMRRTHGLGNLPDQLMPFDELRTHL